MNIQDLSFWERATFFENIDYTIIGAGIVGYSCALHLRKKFPDAKIVILERSYLPAGASSKNAGFACFGSPSELIDDLQNIPSNEVWETVEKRWKGLNYLKELIGDNNLDFQQHGSWDLIHQSQHEERTAINDQLDSLNIEIERITKHKNVFTEDRIAANQFGFQQLETTFYNKLEGQIDSGKMIRTFWQLAVQNNIDILFGLQVNHFETEANKVRISCNYGEFETQNLFICTNGFARQLIQADVLPARAQVLVTSEIPNLPIKGTFHYQKGYYYFRNINNRILLGGGRNLDFSGETTYDLNTTTSIQQALEELLSTVILPHQLYTIDYRWAGIMGVGKTKKPLVKKWNDRVAIGVKMGGMGVAIGSLIGKELAEMV